MKQTRAQEQHFFPWPHEPHGLGLSIIAGELDARRIEGVELDAHTRVLDLSRPWQRARLQLEVRAPKRVVRRVVAKHERDQPSVEILVALRCDRTHLRRQVGKCAWVGGETDRFEFELALDRDEFAGHVELDAYLIRSSELEGSTASVAARRGAQLASARPWLLQIDEPPARSGNYLDVQYRSFATDPAVPPNQRGALYRLDANREDPVLYLNADHERARTVLDGKGTRGRRARTRDLLYERVEAGVWSQLVLRASARLIEDGELAYAWEHAILDQWLPRLYLDQVDDDARRACLARDYQHLPGLLAKIDGALQVAGGLGLVVTKLVDEL